MIHINSDGKIREREIRRIECIENDNPSVERSYAIYT